MFRHRLVTTRAATTSSPVACFNGTAVVRKFIYPHPLHSGGSVATAPQTCASAADTLHVAARYCRTNQSRRFFVFSGRLSALFLVREPHGTYQSANAIG
jgi:hypothetical protein